MPARRSAIRVAVVLAIAGAIFAFSNLEIRAVPPNAAAWSFPLQLQQVDQSNLWESEPIRADVTVTGISWEQAPPDAAWVRASTDGETWTDWAQLVIEAEHGPDPGTDEARRTRPASEPAYVGEATWVQFRVVGNPSQLQAEVIETAGRQRGLADRISDLWQSITWRQPDAEAAPGQPEIIGRDAWGGDRCLGEDAEEPSYTDGVRNMFIHHTATAGSYTEAGALDVIYAICNYHANVRGWKDIGYNFLIDIYGNIYEGRAGGVDRPVWGAHTGGFNYYSFGVALIADHNVSSVGAPAQQALVDLAAWKLDLHHIDPMATVELRSLGSSLYDLGVVVDMPTVAGHRDASLTSCPGDLCYPLLDDFRQAFFAAGGAKIFRTGPVAPVPLGPTQFAFTITEPADWDFQLLDDAGTVLLQASGTGTEVVVDWDGRVDGALVKPGQYRVTLTATTTGGETPTPVDETLAWYRAPFRDDDSNSHEQAINAIAAAEITRGCSKYFDWLFCPDQEVPRDQMASFIARALELDDGTADFFTDDTGNAHEGAINALAEAGITIGCGEGAYCPSRSVSRGEMATFLFRALDLQPVAEDYFIDDNGNPHEAAINAVAAAGVTLGCGGERFCPNEPVSRAQMASFLDRAFLDQG